MDVTESVAGRQIAASTATCNGPGNLVGILVSSASGSPTIKVWDSLAASGTVLVDTLVPLAGTFYPMPFKFRTGCYVEIGGTVSCTVGVEPR